MVPAELLGHGGVVALLHLHRLGVVVHVDHPHPLILQVLRLLWEDDVWDAIAQLLLVYVEDPCLYFVLEEKS